MSVEITDGVHWVGAVDWETRHFHGDTYHVQRGTTYNAYLVVDEQVALVDTVLPGFEGEMLYQIAGLVRPSRIDYVVANHGELDHSGAIPDVMARAPEATLVCTERALESLGRYLTDGWKHRVVRTGDTILLGSKTLTFIEAPMLHWPDSMFTYIPEDRLLLPNDAFGQHLASAQRFADQIDPAVLWEEARRYFANILMPFGQLVVRKVDEIKKMGLDIDIIAPSHGLVWRREPAQIVDQYVRWSKGGVEAEAVVVYETMWGSTREMARAILEGITQAGVEARLFALPQADITTVMAALLEAKGIVVGSATHNGLPLPNIGALAQELTGLRPPNRVGAAFGSYGWASGAVPFLEGRLREAGIEVVQDGLTVTWRPTREERAAAVAFGRSFGEKILETHGVAGQTGNRQRDH